MTEPLIIRKELEALLFNVADMTYILRRLLWTRFFKRMREKAMKKMTPAEREEHKRFLEQMKKNTDRTYELATQMKT